MNLNDKNEVLSKLEYLQDLLYQSIQLDDYEENAYKETIDKIKNIKRELGMLSHIPSVFSNMPVFPTGLEDYEDAKKKSAPWFLRLKIVGIVTTVCIIIFFCFHVDAFRIIGTVGVLATAFLGFVYNTAAKDTKEKKKVYDASLEKYNKTAQAFHSSLVSYEEKVKAGTSAAEEYAVKYRTAYETYSDISSEYDKKVHEAAVQNTQLTQEFNNNNFLSPEYQHLLPNLITILKSGRADSYKEALNLAIQEEKEEQAEAARRAEEERRNQILEAQAAEVRRHNEAMEHVEQERITAEQNRVESMGPRVGSREWKNSLEYVVESNCYRDKNGNYYNLYYAPIPAPVNVKLKK